LPSVSRVPWTRTSCPTARSAKLIVCPPCLSLVSAFVITVSPEIVKLGSAIDSITPPDLTISGLTITTDANTHFQGTSLANLAVGDAVQVDGTLQADGTVLARSIKKIAQEEGDDNEGDDDQGDDD